LIFNLPRYQFVQRHTTMSWLRGPDIDTILSGALAGAWLGVPGREPSTGSDACGVTFVAPVIAASFAVAPWSFGIAIDDSAVGEAYQFIDQRRRRFAAPQMRSYCRNRRIG